MNPFEDSILRVMKGDSVVGAAFLVSDRLVATCAHVVKSADVKVGGKISLCSSDGKEVVAIVDPELRRDENAEDISILRLNESIKNIQPLTLGSSSGTRGHKFSTFGFPKKGQELAGGGEILGQATINGIKVLQLRSPEVTPGFSGAPIFDETTKRTVGMVVAITPPDEFQRLGTTAFAVPSETIREICPELQLLDICPYRSLDVFNEEDAPFFFGRERVVADLLECLRHEPRFLAVLGPSGSGKSSVVRAGLIPALKQGKIAGSRKWNILTVRPQNQPFEQLSVAGMTDPGNGLVESGQKWLADHPKYSRLVLVIDQFEELLVNAPENTRHTFIESLTQLLDSSSIVSVVLVMRDDFFSRFIQDATPLVEWLQGNQFIIPRMLAEDELRAMILAPAIKVGLSFEPGLVDAIITDSFRKDTHIGEGHTADCTILPLLEFTLTQLWEQRQDGFLLHQEYRNLGGVSGSLALWADRTYYSLENKDRSIAQRLLSNLVYLGDPDQHIPDISFPRKKAELVKHIQEEQTLKIIHVLTGARLLVTRHPIDGEEIVEIIHDALLSEWVRLHKWVDDDRRFLTWKQKLSQRYLEYKKGTGELLGGRELAEAQGYLIERRNDLLELNEYVVASINRQKRRIAVITSAIIVIILLGLFAWLQRNSALNSQAAATTEANARATAVSNEEDARATAAAEKELALAQKLSAQAQSINAARNSKQMIAVLLATRSMQIRPSSETSQVLLSNLTGHSIPYLTQNLTQAGVAREVWTVDFSKDGKLIAAGSGNSIFVWEVATGEEIAQMKHEDLVYSIAFSPDGKLLVSGGRDQTVRLWRTSTGDQIYRWDHDGSVKSVGYSEDGKYVVAGGFRTIRIWKTSTGTEIARTKRFNTGPVYSVVFSGDGRLVASADENTARVWDTTTGNEIAHKKTKNSDFHVIALSPDGKFFVSICIDSDFDACVWDIADGEIPIARVHHNGSVTSVAVSADGKYVISGSRDNTARVWEAMTSKEIARMIHDNSVLLVALSPDGKYVSSGSSDFTVRVWDLVTGVEVARMTHDGLIYAAIFSPDSRYVLSGGDDRTIRVWEILPSAEIVRVAHDGSVYSVAISPDGRHVISGGCDKRDTEDRCTQGTARLWEVATNREIYRMTHDGTVYSLAFSRDGKYVVSGGGSFVSIWETLTGKEIAHIQHGSNVYSVAFSPDGRYVVSGSNDFTTRVWNAKTGVEVAYFNHNGDVKTVAFSLDSRYVVSGGGNTACVWNAMTSEKMACLAHEGSVYSVAFSPDGRYVISGDDTTARVWDAMTGQQISSVVHKNFVYSVAFSPDGKYVISGGRRIALVWDPITGREISQMIHDGNVTTVAFGPDGKYVISGDDKTARVWEAMTGNEIARMNHDNLVKSVAFSPDGKYVISGGVDKTARVWFWQPEDLISQTCRYLPRNFTREEWNTYLNDETYQAICPQLPIEPEQPTLTSTP